MRFYGTLSDRLNWSPTTIKIVGWVLVIVAIALALFIVPRYPIAGWALDDYAQSPTSYSFMVEQGTRLPAIHLDFEEISAPVAVIGLLLISSMVSFGLALIRKQANQQHDLSPKKWITFIILVVLSLFFLLLNTTLTNFLFSLNSNWLFLIAVIIAALSGVGLGALMETTLIQPLYSRPIYQLMLTLGMSTIGVQLVRVIWGMPEFVLSKPTLFRGTGGACPASNLADLFEYNCTTIMGGRVRVYDESLPIVGIVVLVGVWLVLKRAESVWSFGQECRIVQWSRRSASMCGASSRSFCLVPGWPWWCAGARQMVSQLAWGEAAFERIDRISSRWTYELPRCSFGIASGRFDPAIYDQIRADRYSNPIH